MTSYGATQARSLVRHYDKAVELLDLVGDQVYGNDEEADDAAVSNVWRAVVELTGTEAPGGMSFETLIARSQAWAAIFDFLDSTDPLGDSLEAALDAAAELSPQAPAYGPRWGPCGCGPGPARK